MTIWKPIATDVDVWCARKGMSSGWELRSYALRLSDGGLAIVSPTRDLGDSAHDELRALGEPMILFAPNHYHYLGLAEFIQRYPGAVCVASPTALPRLQRKAGVEITDLRPLRDRLPNTVQVLEAPGTKTGEAWLRIATAEGTAWLVCDAFFNVVERPTGLIGALLRATQSAPGLTLGKTFLWLGLRHKSEYAAWLLQLLAEDPPSLLLTCHGDEFRDPDLVARLRVLVQERVR